MIEKYTSAVMKGGVLVGISIMCIGLLMFGFGYDETVLWVGTLILLCTPLASVITSYVCLIKLGEKFWVMITTILIIIILIGMYIATL